MWLSSRPLKKGNPFQCEGAFYFVSLQRILYHSIEPINPNNQLIALPDKNICNKCSKIK